MLALTVLVLFGSFLLGREALIGSDQLLANPPWSEERPDDVSISHATAGDTIDIWDPQRQLFTEAALDGDLALWNPFPSGGAPLAAEPSTGTFGVFQVTYLALPDWYAPVVVKVLELAVAVGFTYLLLRNIGLSSPVAVIGGAIYAFNGFQLVWTNWPQTRVGALLPVVLWAVERVVRRRRLVDAAVLAVATAALHLEGFPAVAVAALVAAGLYALVRCAPDLRAREGRSAAVRTLVTAAGGVVVGTGLAAFQLLPFARRLPELGLHREQTPSSHLDALATLTMAAPNAFGAPSDGEWYLPRNYPETLAYVGAAACVLAVLGAVRRRPSGLRPGVRGFAIGATVVGAVLMFVGGPLLSLAQSVPPLDTNFVGRLRAPFALFVAMLAAIGLQTVAERRATRPVEARAARLARAVAAVLAIAAVVALLVHVVSVARDRGYRDDLIGDLVVALVLGTATLAAAVASTFARTVGLRRAAVGAIGVLVVGQSVALWSGELTRSDRDEWFPETPAHAFLGENLGHERVATTGSVLVAGSTARYGIRTVTGHVFTQPTWKEALKEIDPRAFHRSPTYSFLRPSPAVARSPLLDRLAARYVALDPAAAVLGTPGTPPPDPAASARTTLHDDTPAHASIRARRLRGVGITFLEPLRSDDPRARLEVTVTDESGEVRGRGVRRLHGGLDAGRHTVAVDAEGRTADDTGLRVEVELHAADGEVDVAAVDGAVAATPVVGRDDLELVFTDGLQLYERGSALPRIRWTSSRHVIADPEERLDRLNTSGAIADDTVVLSGDGPAASGQPARVDVAEDGLDEVTIDVEAEGRGYLVLADAAQIGWTAAIDGEPVEIHSADHALGAVVVPEGRHRVTFAFRPEGLATGRTVSVASAGLLSVVAIHHLVRERSRRRHAPRATERGHADTDG